MSMNYAYQKTIEKYKDIAGKWRVRVLISDTEAIFLKFDHDPRIEEIKAEVSKYIDNLNRQKVDELELIDEQIKGLQERKIVLEQEVSKVLG